MNRDLTAACERSRTRRVCFAAACSILGTVLILSALSWLEGSAARRGRPTPTMLSLGFSDHSETEQTAPIGINLASEIFGSDEKTESPLRVTALKQEGRPVKVTRVAAIERNGPSRGRTRKS